MDYLTGEQYRRTIGLLCDVTPLLLMSCMKWTSLKKPPLSRPELDVVESMGFELMTPLLLYRYFCHAKMFLLAFIGNVKSLWTPKEIGAIIISPTRELALQISEVLPVFLTHEQLRQKLIIGGGSIEEDIKSVQNEEPTTSTNQHLYHEDLNWWDRFIVFSNKHFMSNIRLHQQLRYYTIPEFNY
uniref:DEAD/DEAH-box helicase domain-containing protein n=1 Tax=Glossina palpalis gambiensis TaxID=67801 RepID=A0A1B0BQM6_9MUSC